jgi:thiol-disulfide isomerase/thioredoxin
MLSSIRPAALVSLAFLIAFALAVGCDRSSVRDARTDPTDIETPSLDVKLKEGDRETFAQILSGHQGQVVLVDFWATWCGPCVKQFPHTIELAHKFRDRGLAVVTVSMNESKERESVLAFLVRQKADVDNLLPIYGAGSEFLEAFDLRGDVPFYKLYDRQGVLRYTFSADPEGIENCESIEMIDQRVEELLMSEFQRS